MDVLQMIFTIGLALTILSIVFTLYYLVSFISLRSKLKKHSEKTSRNKRKRRRRAQERLDLITKKNKVLKKVIILLTTSLILTGGVCFITYYQSTSLSAEDTEYLTEGYYYLRDLQEELEKISSGEKSAIESRETANYLATALASYSLKTASSLNTVEGQSTLNRYYTSLSELGINVSKQLNTVYDNSKIAKELLEDSRKIEAYQKKAFDYYKVDESLLKKQK